MTSFSDKPQIMGILNVTPDSFSDGGQFNCVELAVKQAQQMIEEGAEIIDIGGESTRPGADPVSAQEQINRVLPVIKSIRNELTSEILISIDTTLSLVAEAALDAGANIINDVSAGRADNSILSLAAQRQVPIILMHSQGSSKTMQDNPYYDDVVKEIIDILYERIDAARHAGVQDSQIMIDPGIGFGKRKQDNLDLMANLQHFVKMGFPVLLGTSRKRFMGSICQVENPSDLVVATSVTTAIGVMAGVQMFRVHDVKENKQALDVSWAIKQAGTLVE